MQLFYSDLPKQTKTTYTFPREESKHIIKVLRKRIDDHIYITNGRGHLFTSIIIDENPNKCTVSILSYAYHEPLPYYLHMAVAPTKLNDRFEWFLEKATEIGISEITPILCDNSERKTIKTERYNKILQSALKQSLQYHLPKLNNLTPLKDFLASSKQESSIKCIAHCEKGPKQTLNKLIKKENRITILIGPEGDFSTSEIKKALDNEFTPITLGNTRLRTETAALLACASVSISRH